MLSKAQSKYVRSLSQQKYRQEHNVYLVEGAKVAEEWLHSKEPVEIIIAIEPWVAAHQNLIASHQNAALHMVTEQELESLSTQQAPDQVLLVVKMPATGSIPEIRDWCIALDNIRDPGNLGAIIRIADWFGIRNIFCSDGCAEVYNPKVIRAAMGGHLRVQMHEVNLGDLLKQSEIPIYAATLEGTNIYEMPKDEAAILIIGNESKGVSADLLALATHQVMIPRRGGAESLNAAVATGILCALLIR